METNTPHHSSERQSTASPPHDSGGWEDLSPDLVERLDKAIADGHIVLKNRGPVQPVVPLDIPGVSASKELLAMRGEE